MWLMRDLAVAPGARELTGAPRSAQVRTGATCCLPAVLRVAVGPKPPVNGRRELPRVTREVSSLSSLGQAVGHSHADGAR